MVSLVVMGGVGDERIVSSGMVDIVGRDIVAAAGIEVVDVAVNDDDDDTDIGIAVARGNNVAEDDMR